MAFEVPILLKAGIVLGWFALLFWAERFRPAAPRPQIAEGWHRLGRNVGLWAVTAVASPVIVVPISALAAGHGMAWRPAWWSGWTGLALDLLLLDLFIYAWHRANHEVGLLWRFHEVHHLDRFLDTTTAGRFHLGEVILSAGARGVLIWAASLPLASVIVFETMVQVASLFHHSNVRLPGRVERLLSLAIITPSRHWVHHHRLREDTDSTYGTVLSVWDRLLRTTTPTQRMPRMEIGTEGEEEQTLPQLLLRPFRPGRAP